MAKVFAIWSSVFFDVTWKPRGAIHSTKTPTGPTGNSGPTQKVDTFFRNFFGWTEPIHWVLDWNFRIERRSVTSRYHGSTISGWQQNLRRRRRQGERPKIICLYQQTRTLHMHHAILYISLPSLHHYNIKITNFTSLLYGVGEHNTKIVASFF